MVTVVGRTVKSTGIVSGAPAMLNRGRSPLIARVSARRAASSDSYQVTVQCFACENHGFSRMCWLQRRRGSSVTPTYSNPIPES